MYPIFKIVHFAAVIGVFAGLGALAFHGLNGGTKENNNAKLWPIISHGVGLLILFVTGFGMLGVLSKGMEEGSKYTAFPFPLWVWVKIGLFFAIGGMLALVMRKPKMGAVWWISLPILGAIAAGVAIFKPGS